jgi:hypothetical protein
MKFRKKPVVVDAILFTGGNQGELVKFAGHHVNVAFIDKGVTIDTLEGMMTVSPGDWVIKGVKGEFYPCKPDVFMLTYEAVADEPTTKGK